jgi:DNA helicase HerA-like ATPase
MILFMKAFEKLGAFYLGRVFDLENNSMKEDLLLYDSKDMTTHGLCVGMTGSGKTGLCVSLLEEAAIDGIPAIVIDPKGDLPNLLLNFPKLRPEDFRPWIDESEAARNGFTAAEYASKTADLWRKGLAKWGEDGSRILKFRDSAEILIYTPGSSAGLPVSVLRSFDAPPAQFVQDQDALRDRILGSVSGLLTLLGIDADPIRSREHILLSNILHNAWSRGKNLDIPAIIREIQSPPFDKVGVLIWNPFFREKTGSTWP